MKKWVDMTRSRVIGFNLRNALRPNDTESENTSTRDAYTPPLDSEKVCHVAEAISHEGSDSADRKRLSIASAETGLTDSGIMDRLASLESENAILKNILDEQRQSTSKDETSDGDVNKSIERTPQSDYDPLGVASQGEIDLLRNQLSSITAELKDCKTQASREIAEIESQLRVKELENGELHCTVEDLELQLQSIKEEFQRFRQQSVSNVERYEQQLVTLSEQLHHERKGNRHQRSKSLMESFPEHCDQPFLPSFLQTGTSYGEDAQSTDIEWSVGQDSTHDEVEEYQKKIHQLTQSLRSMGAKQKDLQRRLIEAQDERDYMKSVTEDLQQQLDAASPRTSTELRVVIQTMQADMSRLKAENTRLRGIHRRSSPEIDSDIHSSAFVVPEDTADGQWQEENSEKSERLMDCSLEIMGELAHATADMDVGVSMTFVQYAGLLAAVQKAIKQLELSKQNFTQSIPSFRTLDRTLSKTLSISHFRVRAPMGEGDKRLDELHLLVKERESGLKFMEQLLGDLRLEIKGHASLTLQQEVQMEYIKQQLSASDKVISLTWELENVKRALDECQRELKSQKDLNDQQQQELTIQWQSKQQAVAETLSQNHRVFSFSQQLEHVVEAKEALEADRQDLEETLGQTRLEIAQLKEQCNARIKSLYDETSQLKAELKKAKQNTTSGISRETAQEILQLMMKLGEAVESASRHAQKHFGEQKLEWIQILAGIANDCTAWKHDTSALLSDQDALSQKLKDTSEKLVTAQSLQKRAEQEKEGLQEILALTSETTSAEILKLQTQLEEVSTERDNEKQNAAENRTRNQTTIAGLQETVQRLEETLSREQLQNSEHTQSLNQKLDYATKDNANLETRMGSYKDVIATLNKDVTSYEAQLKELNKIAEQNANAFRAEKESVELLQKELDRISEELEQSTSVTVELQQKCDQAESLRHSIAILTEEKSQLKTEITRWKAREIEQLKTQTALEQHVEDLKAKNNDLVRHRLHLEEQLQDKRETLVLERTKWDADVAALVHRDTPKEQWPSSILLIAQHCEKRAVEDLEQENRRRIAELQSRLERSEEDAKQAKSLHEEEIVEYADESRSLTETIENLQLEMRERDSTLQKEIADIKKANLDSEAKLATELKEMRAAYDTLKEQSDGTITKLTMQYNQREQQLTDVQEKAREMMKERDEEINRLKRLATSEEQSPREIAPATDTDASASTVDKLRSDVAFLRRLVFDLTSSLEESERTHELRNKADEVLRSEVSAYERSKRREGLNLDYLKNILVNAFEKGTLPKSSPMFTILARLLEFSQEEMDRIKTAASISGGGGYVPPPSSSSSSTFFSSWMRP